MKKSRYTRYFKYPLDCLIAAFLILLTSPVLLSTILLLAIANRGSGIFFLQERPGKNGKIFRIIKFKTMNDRKDCRGNFFTRQLTNDPHRENSPCHLRWRTASTFQRIERRHGSDRPPSIIGTIPASIQWRASKKTWSAPRHHWMGTSKWKKRNQLEKENSNWISGT